MSIPIKKLNSGFNIPVFGIGTWMMGGDKLRNSNNDDKSDIQAIKTAIEMGITHIDTAENYAEGWAENLIGKAIKGKDRGKLFITSKVDKTHLTYMNVIAACKGSLNRLQTDYLNLYLIHAPNPEIPLKETIEAMDKLIEDGLVKNIGVSNFKTSRLIEAQKYSKNKIVTNQVYYNLMQREPEKDGLLSYCQENDVILTSYRPIDKGALLQNPPKIILDLCKKYKKTVAQIIINWIISQKNVVTLSKMSNPKHVEENLGALGWKMRTEDIEMLRKNYPNQSIRSDLLPLR